MPAAEEAQDSRNPLETAAELRAFVAAARARFEAITTGRRAHRESGRGHIADMLQLDAGGLERLREPGQAGAEKAAGKKAK